MPWPRRISFAVSLHGIKLRTPFTVIRRFSSSPLEGIVDENEQKRVLSDTSFEKIRNFGIIAHVDHGKSTLADRLLELAGNVKAIAPENAQILDNLQVERERGITVKAQTASLFYRHQKNGQTYLLNLIDTPGHVDFSYEVSRSLAACQGVLLLVDASQGIQAQTLANFYLALEANLDIIPVITKIDLPHAEPTRVAQEMITAFEVKEEEILYCSSKTGKGVLDILPAIIERVRPPTGDRKASFRGLLFDSWYSAHRGVICLVSVKDGLIGKGDRIESYHKGVRYDVQEVGILKPTPTPTEQLRAGQVGYVIANIRSTTEVRLGETFFKLGTVTDRQNKITMNEIRKQTVPLPGFQAAKSMVFAGLFPSSESDFTDLQNAIEKLALNDPSVSIAKENSMALGSGYRCGFLGVLHMDVFKSRLEQEFNAEVIITAPTVPFKAVSANGQETLIESPATFPEGDYIFYEPMITATIITPDHLQTTINEIIMARRGEVEKVSYLSEKRLLLTCKLPLTEAVVDLHEKIKSVSSGFASYDYEPAGYAEADLIKLELKINGEIVDPLSVICHRLKAEEVGRRLVHRLKNEIDRQSYEVIIQAALGKKIIARERIPPYRKDVLTKGGKTVGGGDKTRKTKLLEKQKAGKKRMKMVGNVQLNEKVFLAVMQRGE